MDDRQFFEKQFHDIHRMIDTAIQKADAGEIIALDRLNRDSERLCNQLQNTDPQTAQAIQPLLAQMIAGLDELEVKLRDIHAEMADKTT